MGREMRTQLARQAGIEGHARAGVVLLKSCLDPSLDPEEGKTASSSLAPSVKKR